MSSPTTSFHEFTPKPTKHLMDLLLSVCRHQNGWELVCARIISHPWDAFYTSDITHGTPLHVACYYKAPLQVIQLLLKANVDAVHFVDTNGWTPLYRSLLYGQMNEPSCLLLIQNWGQCMIPMTDSNMYTTALHIACRHGASTKVLEELVKLDPTMVKTLSTNRKTAFELLWNHFYQNYPYLREKLSNSIIYAIQEDPSVIKLVSDLKVLLGAMDTSSFNNTTISLHEMIVNADHMGLANFLVILVHLYPEQLKIMNEQGNMLLHLACCWPLGLQLPLTDHHAHVGDILEIVLQKYPLAASKMNSNGRYPLHLALMLGRRTWTTGVAALVKAFPEALLSKDPVTGLFPAQLAAVSKEGLEHVKQLDTIMELVLACPPVVVS